MKTTKKENTKKEEIVEIKETEIEEEVEEIETRDEELTEFLKNLNMDDEFIQKVLLNEDLETAFIETMDANKKPAKKTPKDYFGILKEKASEKKEVIKNAAIVVGITGAAVGATYAICSVADEYDDEEIEEADSTNEDEPYVEVIETTEGKVKITTEMVSDED